MLDAATAPLVKTLSAAPEQVGAGLNVMRAIPADGLEAVGPFVFLDHFGPAPAPAGGVPPHPHAGIEVITLLLEGENRHRDSLGNDSAIVAGGAQLFASGRGLLHAEYPRGEAVHIVQLWTRLPRALDDAAPHYKAAAAEEIPTLARDGATARLVAGELPALFETPGPLALASPALLLHLRLSPGAVFAMEPPQEFEMAVYVLAGEARLGAARLSRDQLGLLRTAAPTRLENGGRAPLEALLLGGAPVETPLIRRGPFVFNTAEAVERAFRDYADGRMGRLDGAAI